MTVRLPVLRSGVPLLILVVALFVHTALGSLLAHAPVQDGPAVLAAVEAERQVGPCLGCLLVDGAGPARVATGTDTTPDADAGPAELQLCTPHWPCQHGPQEGHDGGDVVVRGLALPRDGGPCLLTACLKSHPPGLRAEGVSVSGPVPPLAVRAPVAVLGVDRN